MDRITLTGELVVEIKCPFQGRDSTLWQEIESGRLPEHYFWQVQHQLMVSNFDFNVSFTPWISTFPAVSA